MAHQIESPVKIDRRGDKLTVRMRSTGDELAWCYIGDDAATEAIADLLSAKGLGAAAMEFREIVAQDRKTCGRRPPAKRGLIEKVFG